MSCRFGSLQVVPFPFNGTEIEGTIAIPVGGLLPTGGTALVTIRSSNPMVGLHEATTLNQLTGDVSGLTGALTVSVVN